MKSKNRMYALGRLKQGQMNKTESAYVERLERLKMVGEILWYKFEGIKFRLADNTFYTPDFMIMTNACEIIVHEVKGYMMDDANVKVKVAAELYPFRFFIVRKQKIKDGGGWDIREV